MCVSGTNYCSSIKINSTINAWLSSQVGVVVMARPGRPASESYQRVCCSVSQSVSYSSEDGAVGLEDENDQAPIFSLSKSSMDVVMGTGVSHRTRMDLRRSSSTNTPSERSSFSLQKLRPHTWQHTNSLQLPLTTQNMEVHSTTAHSECLISNMQRWSACSGSAHSRSSTPDTVIWKAETSRPLSLTQDTLCSPAPESPLSKLASPPATPSPFISPLHTPTLSSEHLLASAASLTLSTNQQEDLLACSSSRQSGTSSSLTFNSPSLHPPTTVNEGFLENNLLSFQFPSPIPSSVSLAEVAVSPDPECFVDNAIYEPYSHGVVELSEGEGKRSPVQMFMHPTSSSSAEERESRREALVYQLELPLQTGQSCRAGIGRRSNLVSSLSDSRLRDCCRCTHREGPAKVEAVREGGTMTSQLVMVDAAVQTISPVGSWWDLRRNTSNMGSHSILGSPPGSRLNLKSSVGSNSNLVSPSSSMFPVSSGEEEERQPDDPTWDANSASSHDLERKRPCLKIQMEEKDELGRRSSMKQVQWGEEGVTWDNHGASVNPEVLNTAILKHLEHHNSPQPLRRSSKKQKAPKPPLPSNVVKAITPELNLPMTITTSTCIVEGSSEGTPEADGRRDVAEEEDGKKEETAEAVRRISKAEGANTKEEEEVNAEEGASHPKSASRASGRKKSVIRSLRRPGWCGGSRKADD